MATERERQKRETERQRERERERDRDKDRERERRQRDRERENPHDQNSEGNLCTIFLWCPDVLGGHTFLSNLGAAEEREQVSSHRKRKTNIYKATKHCALIFFSTHC